MPLTREQFNKLRGQGLSVDQIVRFEKGEKPVQVEQKPGFIESAVSPYAQRQTGRTDDLLSTNEAFKSGEQGLGSTAFQTTANAVGGAISPFTEGVSRILQAAGKITPDFVKQGLGAVAQPIKFLMRKSAEGLSEFSGIQKFAESDTGKTTARNIEAANELIQDIAPVPKGSRGAIGAFEKLPGGGPMSEAKFTTTLNKALPVLKKDVQNLPAKIQSAKTAFTDIVMNKEKINIVDENGLSKSPGQYTFEDVVQAQRQRLPQIYKEYTSKLKPVDKTAFDERIYKSIFKQIDSIDAQLKIENSIDGRKALTKIKGELGSLRDTSPEGIQSYIESINQRIRPVAPGGSLSLEQIKLANLGGELRKVLDDAVEDIGGSGYQELRSTYAAHKAIQSQLLQAAKSELNKTPGWTDRVAGIGMTAEGINFLLTHDPHALAIAAGIKVSKDWIKFMRSPQRALRAIFNDIEQSQRRNPASLSPNTINPTASNIPSASIDGNISQLSPEVQRIIRLSQ